MPYILFPIVFTIAVFSVPALAAPSLLPFKQFAQFCNSKTMEEARQLGDQLGWEPLGGEELLEFKTSTQSYLQGDVEIVSWRSGSKNKESSLNFWILDGQNAHINCSYSGSLLPDYLDDMIAEYGKTEIIKSAGTTIAFWSVGKTEVSYVGSEHGQSITIAHFK